MSNVRLAVLVFLVVTAAAGCSWLACWLIPPHCPSPLVCVEAHPEVVK